MLELETLEASIFFAQTSLNMLEKESKSFIAIRSSFDELEDIDATINVHRSRDSTRVFVARLDTSLLVNVLLIHKASL